MNDENINLTQSQIIEQMRDIFLPWVDDADQIDTISEQTNLISDLGLDSIGILQVVLGAEKEFGISIDDKQLDSNTFSMMGNFVSLIQEKVNEAH